MTAVEVLLFDNSYSLLPPSTTSCPSCLAQPLKLQNALQALTVTDIAASAFLILPYKKRSLAPKNRKEVLQAGGYRLTPSRLQDHTRLHNAQWQQWRTTQSVLTECQMLFPPIETQQGWLAHKGLGVRRNMNCACCRLWPAAAASYVRHTLTHVAVTAMHHAVT